MSDLEKQHIIEKENLNKILEKDPLLLKRRTFIEDSEYISKLGIFIPSKSDFKNKGFIKLWSEDFIVEEITQSGQIISIFEEQEEEIENKDERTNFSATLIKNNIGTNEVVFDLAKKLNIKDTDIQYSGMKDHDALTSQKISIQNVSFKDLNQIKSSKYFLTNIKKDNSRLRVGQLNGNHFTILVRSNLENTDINQISEKIKDLKDHGFYNFYYTQRFGTFGRDNGHILGLLTLQKKYDEALFLFLTDAPKAGFEFTFQIYEEIKSHYGEWDYIEKIISPYPIIFERELKIIRHLIQNPKDTIGALSAKKDEVKLWILGFASWLFNMKLSDYLIKNEIPPEKIDLITSSKENIVSKYKKELESLGLENFDLKHLERFNIQLAKDPIDTKKKVNFKKVISSPYGLIFQFSLDKGSYATTMLAHCLDLISGEIPESYSKERIDCLKSIWDESVSEILKRFN